MSIHQRNSFKIKHASSKILISTVGAFFVAFSAAFIASSIFAPSDTTNADSLFFTFEGTDYTISVNSADTINLELYTTPSGAVGIASDTITTTTNNPEGYKLYLAMDQSADYDSTHPGNALYQDGNSTSSYFISPTTGTISEPDTLSTNTWGFALVGGDNKETGVPDTFSNFDPVYVDSNGNSSTGETNKVLNPDSKFAAVPLHPDAVLVQESDTATPTTGNSLQVYYGVNGSMALPSGSYIGTISYFVLSDSSSSLVDGISVFPNTIDTNGEEISIATSLHTNYTFNNDDIAITLTDTTDSTNTGTCTVNSTNTDTGSLIIHCDTSALAEGTYKLKVSIPMYGKEWETEVTIEQKTTPAGTDFWSITYMQEMTPEICSEIKTPSNATGTNVSIITIRSDHSGTIAGAKETLLVNNMAEYNAIVTNNGADDGENKPYVAQRILYDIRDDKGYTVRKLADGNCWMTSNLQLELNSTTTYKDYGSYNDGTTFDLTPGDSTLPTWSSCGSNGACAFNTNTPAAGGFYSWYAATAGKGRSTDSAGTDINGSICPKGWKLPQNYTINNAKSYQTLVNTYSSTSYTILEAVPLSFSRSGFYYSGGLYDSGSDGYYWSSTASSASYAYYLDYVTSAVYPQHEYYKYYGFSVRCLAL